LTHRVKTKTVSILSETILTPSSNYFPMLTWRYRTELLAIAMRSCKTKNEPDWWTLLYLYYSNPPNI